MGGGAVGELEDQVEELGLIPAQDLQEHRAGVEAEDLLDDLRYGVVAAPTAQLGGQTVPGLLRVVAVDLGERRDEVGQGVGEAGRQVDGVPTMPPVSMSRRTTWETIRPAGESIGRVARLDAGSRVALISGTTRLTASVFTASDCAAGRGTGRPKVSSSTSPCWF